MLNVRPFPVDEPGLYDLTAEEYHADPCPVPSLNHTIAKIIHEQTPLHAYRAHPRLGGQKMKRERIMDIGTAVHALAIGKGAKLARMDFPDFRTKAAQEMRASLEASGVTPLLAADYDKAEAMWPAMRDAIEHVARASIDTLHREVSAIAYDAGAWSRSMIDVATPDLRLLIDAKTTASANPEKFGKAIMNYYATAVAFYFQTLDLIDPEGKGKRRFVFIAQERDCPDAITYHELDYSALKLADEKMKRARLRWALCQATDAWPAYDRGPHVVYPNPWDIDAEADDITAGEQ